MFSKIILTLALVAGSQTAFGFVDDTDNGAISGAELCDVNERCGQYPGQTGGYDSGDPNRGDIGGGGGGYGRDSQGHGSEYGRDSQNYGGGYGRDSSDHGGYDRGSQDHGHGGYDRGGGYGRGGRGGRDDYGRGRGRGDRYSMWQCHAHNARDYNRQRVYSGQPEYDVYAAERQALQKCQDHEDQRCVLMSCNRYRN